MLAVQATSGDQDMVAYMTMVTNLWWSPDPHSFYSIDAHPLGNEEFFRRFEPFPHFTFD